MTTKRLAAGCEEMLALLPANAPEVQRKEMKRAFYMGATVMLKQQLMIADDTVTEDEGVEILTELAIEINDFKKQIMEGKA